MLRSSWFIARKDLAYLLTRKETILWTFVMPIIFFYFIGTVTSGFGGPGGSGDEPDALALRAPEGSGFLLDELVLRLEEQNYAIEQPTSPEEFEAYSRRLTVPSPEGEQPGFTQRVIGGEEVAVTFDRRGEGPGTQFDQIRVGRAIYTVLADLVVIAQEGDEPSPETFQRLAERPRAMTLDVKPAGKRKHIPTGFEQTIPGTMVMFTMLVLLTGGATILVIEREQGLLRRLASTPISRGSVVLGKWTGKMCLGLVQIAFAMLAGTVLFRMQWGSALPMICVVLFAWASFNASLGILLANLVRSRAQMDGVGVLTTMVLAAVGGCWWPIEITPDWMQKLALFLPTGWAMDAMHKLISFGYGAESALNHVLVMVGAALVLGWLGARTFRYE